MPTTNWITPASVVEGTVSGRVPWANVSDSRIIDGASATCTMTADGTSQDLIFTGFDFSAEGIASNAIIKGIEIKRVGSGSNGFYGSSVYSVTNNGENGGVKTPSGFTTPTDSSGTIIFGSASDLWGSSITAAHVAAGNLRFVLQTSLGNITSNPESCTLNGVQARITWELPLLNVLDLSSSSIGHKAATGTVVGSLSGQTTGSTLSFINNAGGLFALSGSNVTVAADLTSSLGQQVTIVVRETKVDYDNSPRDTAFTITVTRSYQGPIYHGAGAQAAGSGNVTPALPSGWAVNDILITLVESDTDGTAINVPSGWAQMPNSPQAVGTAGSGPSVRLTAFWRRAVAGNTAQAITSVAATNHKLAQTFAIRGCVTSGDPFDVSSAGTIANSNTLTATGLTTTFNDTLVVLMGASSIDNAGARFTFANNTSVSNPTKRIDAGTTSGNGGSLVIWTGEKGLAGAVNSNTATVSLGAGGLAFMTVAFKSPNSVAAGGGSTDAAVLPGSTALAVSGKAPTCSSAAIAQPSFQALSVQAFAPLAAATTVEPHVNATALALPGSISVAGRQPSIQNGATVALATGSVAVQGKAASASASVLVEALRGILALSSFAPTAEATQGVSAQPGSGSLTITGMAPHVSSAVQAVAGTSSLAITGRTPQAQASTNVSALPASAALTITAQAPVSASGSAASPQAGAVALAGRAPALASGSASITGVGALVIQGFVPSLNSSAKADTQSSALNVTGHEASVSTSANGDVLPGTGALAITGFAPSIASDTKALPGVSAIAITGLGVGKSASANSAPLCGTVAFWPRDAISEASCVAATTAAILAVQSFAPDALSEDGPELVYPHIGDGAEMLVPFASSELAVPHASSEIAVPFASAELALACKSSELVVPTASTELIIPFVPRR